MSVGCFLAGVIVGMFAGSAITFGACWMWAVDVLGEVGAIERYAARLAQGWSGD